MPYIPTFSLRHRHLMKTNTHCCECRRSRCLPSNWRTQYTFRVLSFTWCILLDVVLLLLDVCHSVDKHWSNVVCHVHILALHHFFDNTVKTYESNFIYTFFFWLRFTPGHKRGLVTLVVWTNQGIFTVLRLIYTNSTNRNWPFWKLALKTAKCLTLVLIKGGTYLWEQVRVQVRVQLAVPRIWVFGQEPPGIFWCPQKSRWGRSSVEEATRVIRKEMP